MSATSSYYRPPSGWDYELDEPEGGYKHTDEYSAYHDIWGVPHPEHFIQAKIDFYSYTGDDYSNESEWVRKGIEGNIYPAFEHTSEADKNYFRRIMGEYTTGGMRQQEWRNKTKSKIRDVNDLVTYRDQYEYDTGQEYDAPKSLVEAKLEADRAYMANLQRQLNDVSQHGQSHYITKAKIEEAIRKGVLDFNDPQSTTYITANQPAYEAAKEQAQVMKNYLVENDIPLYQEYEDGGVIKDDKVYINTGTALQYFEDPTGLASLYYGSASGDLGSYSLYQQEPPPPEDRSFKAGARDFFTVASTALSVAFPASAPLISGANTLIQGGDLEDALKSAGKTFVQGEISEITGGEITDAFKDLGIDITTLPTPAQNVILDTSKAVLQGDSGTNEFKKSATGELLDAIDVDLDLPSGNFDTPEFLENFGDAIVSGVKTAGEVVEDILKPPLELVESGIETGVDFVADTFEPVVDAIDTGLDVLGEELVDPALQAGKEFGQDVIDVGSDVLSEAEDIFIEPIKEGVEALSDIDLPDVNLPDLPNLNLPDLNLSFPDLDFSLGGLLGGQPSQQQQAITQTPVEGLFDKELFKFDTEIKSTQEMLSPMMNLRKYG